MTRDYHSTPRLPLGLSEIPGAPVIEDEAIEVMRERFLLAQPGVRVGGRGVALMAIDVHVPGSAAGVADAPYDHRLATAIQHRLRDALRRTDVLASSGPMRYLAFVERLEDGPFAVHAADALVAAIRHPFRDGDREIALVASVGVSVHPDDGDHFDALLEGAEGAMQAARLGGGDLFGFSSTRMSARSARRLEIERALGGALERGEMEVHWQPQIDARDGSVCGVEALLRWRNARLGQVAPDEFIPLLEANGGIDAVGRWVLGRACEQGAAWSRERHALRIGVNVSARQLADPAFAYHVRAALDLHGLDPKLLELELTESVLVDNVPETRRLLDSLRSSGVRIALDDFGTGYASLACLRQFPMDTVKIDRQFVRGLPVDAENAAITSAIAALAGSLRLHLVAEGVETEAEEEFLGSLRCHVMQGFRHARPMSVTALSDWLRRRPWA